MNISWKISNMAKRSAGVPYHLFRQTRGGPQHIVKHCRYRPGPVDWNPSIRINLEPHLLYKTLFPPRLSRSSLQ